jgi:hypothetical protein
VAVLIGSTTIGGGNTTFGGGDAAGTRFQAAADGTVETMSLYGRNSAADVSVKLGIYSDSSSLPNSLLGETGNLPGITGADGVRTAAMLSNVPITSGTFYWLFLMVASSGSFFNASYATTGGFRGDTGIASFPSTWTPAGDFSGTEGLPIQGDGTLTGWPPSGSGDSTSRIRTVQSNVRLA